MIGSHNSPANRLNWFKPSRSRCPSLLFETPTISSGVIAYESFRTAAAAPAPVITSLFHWYKRTTILDYKSYIFRVWTERSLSCVGCFLLNRNSIYSPFGCKMRRAVEAQNCARHCGLRITGFGRSKNIAH